MNITDHPCFFTFYSYGTAQLQGNVHKCLERVRDASGMHAGRIWDARKTRLECARGSYMQVQKTYDKAAVRLM